MRTLYRLFLHWEVLGEGVGQVSQGLRAFIYFFNFFYFLDGGLTACVLLPAFWKKESQLPLRNMRDKANPQDPSWGESISDQFTVHCLGESQCGPQYVPVGDTSPMIVS